MHPEIVRLSAREPLEDGTQVASAVRPLENSPHPTSSRLVLLVHGYNNTAAEAAESYERFVENVNVHRLQRHGQVCCLHWPGNKKWGIFSALAYPLEIRKAKESAARLARYLADYAAATPGGWPLDVTLICHSLGNRLALELVDSLRRHPRIRVPHACLFAAAVPTFRVDPGGSLRAAAEAISRSLVLHSGSDAVLHYAFPLGQTAALDGVFPTAVGRFGHPGPALWTTCGNMGRHAYGHGHYWPGTECAEHVMRFLGEAVAVLPAPAGLPAPPELDRAEIGSRTLPSRATVARGLHSLA